MLTNSTTNLLDFDPYRVDATQNMGNGVSSLVLENGVRFIKARAGASSPIGQLALTASPVANHQNLAVVGTTSVAGGVLVSFTNGATALTASQYAGGVLVVNAGLGLGTILDIKDHAAVAGSATGVIELARELPVTLDTTSRISFIANEYAAVAPAASGAARRAAGVPRVTVPSGSYGWYQTNGLSAVLAGAAVSLGGVLIPASTSGAVETNATVGGVTSNKVGSASVIALVSGEYRPAMLDI